MATQTFTAQLDDNGSRTFVTFYKEMPGGWKLDFRDAQGDHVANGDHWIETLDDLVLQLTNFTTDDLNWHTEDNKPVSFFAAVRECILASRTP